MLAFLEGFFEPFKILGLDPKNLLNLFNSFLSLVWQIIKNWWWLPLPFLLWPHFKYHWYFWRAVIWSTTVKNILLEIKLPEEAPKSIKAMEQVFAGFHAAHDVLVWREKWIEGQYQLVFSLEIVSLGGEIHFYIRTPEQFRNIVESTIYAQYPEAEIFEVEDYTNKVPQDIPNREWDLFGTDIINTKEDPYPIKTYIEFEAESETQEEKKIDPLAILLEGLATLKEGEQFWLQIRIKPIREEKPWVKRGLEIRDEFVKRPAPPKPKSMFQEALEILIKGPSVPKPEEKQTVPGEMRLTPGEREIVAAIERKISKFGFDCNIRYIYLAKRDVFFKPRARIPYTFFKELSYETSIASLGGFKPSRKQMTKVKSTFLWFLDERRLYLRKRRIFRYYQSRLPPLFPREGNTYVLNTEELATLYHFPGKVVVPISAISRIEPKKSTPPPGLVTR